MEAAKAQNWAVEPHGKKITIIIIIIGTNIWSGQLDDALVRWKKDYININLKKNKF
jgi:hypothetical protein